MELELKAQHNDSRKLLIAFLSIPFLLIIFPFSKPYLSHIENIRYMTFGLSILLCSIYHTVAKAKLEYRFHIVEIPIISFIALSFASMTWSLNYSFALFQSFSWLLLYLFFIQVKVSNLSNTEQRYLHLSIVGILIVSITYFIYINFDFGILKRLATFTLNKKDFKRNFINENNLMSTWAISVSFIYYVQHRSKLTACLKYFVLFIISLLILIGPSQGAKIVIILFFIIVFIKKLYSNYFAERSVLLLLSTIIALVTTFLALSSAKLNIVRQFKKEFFAMDERLLIWDNSIELFKTAPIFGIGAGNWPTEIYKFGIEQYAFNTVQTISPYVHAHNLFIEVLSELGIVGLILLCMFMILPLRMFIKTITSNRDRDYILSYPILGFVLLCFLYGTIYFDYHVFGGTIILVFYSVAFTYRRSPGICMINYKPYLLLIVTTLVLIWFSLHAYNDYRLLSIEENVKLNPKEKLQQIEAIQNRFTKTHYLYPFRSINRYQIIPLSKKTKDYDNVLRSYEELLKYDPYNASQLLKYSEFLIAKKKYKKAWEIAMKVKKINPTNEKLKEILKTLDKKIRK